MKNEDLQIQRLKKEDISKFEELISLFHEVFETSERNPASRSYLNDLLLKPDFIVLVILYKNKLAGGLTAYELPLYTAEYSELYLYDIAIKKEFQRQGAGQQIIEALKQYCKENNIHQFFVEAHAEDQYAVDFYTKAGGDPEKVIHFNFGTNE